MAGMTVSEFIKEWESPLPYIIAHTSGSTGKPKEIHLPKTLVYNSALRTVDFFKLDSSSKLHLILSPDYIAGKMMIVRSLICGAKLTYEEPSNSPLIPDNDISFMAAVPSQIPHILEKAEISGMNPTLIVGGSSIPQAIREDIAKSGIEAYETYGMTETASHVALRRITADSSDPFRLLPGIKGFINDKKTLSLKSKDFDISTNDEVKFISTDEFIYLGRTDNVIISGGIKIHPEEIEHKISILLNQEKITGDYVVAGLNDSKWGAIPVLVLTDSDRGKTDINSGIYNFLAYAKPKKIIYIDSIPKTSNGKINRRILDSLLNGNQ